MADLAPMDATMTLDAHNIAPFPIYRHLREETPVCRVAAARRTFVAKAKGTEIRGCVSPEDNAVMTIQARANPEEGVVDHGDVYRDRVPHHSFGNGPDLCERSRVARRAVGQFMLPNLFDRFPDMSLPHPDAVIWRGVGFGGPIKCPMGLNR